MGRESFGYTSLFLLIFIIHSSYAKGSTVCYSRVGCFSGGSPWFSSQRPFNKQPISPDDLKTQYLLYTRGNPGTPETMDARHPDLTKWPSYEPDRETKFVVHGFLNTITDSPWMKELGDELLKYGDYNVIIVDWQHGNQMPYEQAVGNTRLVGAQIADLISVITDATQQTPADFHIMGHSLGAHIGGYVGHRVEGLGRISGMDPAGPYFRNTEPLVRLDATDAVFVDAVHSDGKKLVHLGFGMLDDSGDSDFYPNLGHDQPGCSGKHSGEDNKTTSQDDNEFVACNHDRSWKFYTESINSHCPFLAFPCASEDDFVAGKCQTCTHDSCRQMGYHSTPPDAHTKYYLRTSDHLPFCEYPLGITVTLDQGHTDEQGYLKVKLYGVKETTDWIQLNSKIVDFTPGCSFYYTLGTHAQIGEVNFVEVGFHHVGPWTNPLKWNLFGLRHPKLMLESVSVHTITTTDSDIQKFCITKEAALVETDQTIRAINKC